MKKYLLLSLFFTLLTVAVFIGIFFRDQVVSFVKLTLNLPVEQEKIGSDFKDVLLTAPDFQVITPEELDSSSFKNYSNENISLKIPNSYQVSLDKDLIKFSKDDKNYFFLKSLNTSQENGSIPVPNLSMTKEGIILRIVDPFTDFQRLNITKPLLQQIFLEGNKYKSGEFEYRLNDYDLLGLKHRFKYYRVSNPTDENPSLLDERYQVVVLVGEKKTVIISTTFSDSSFEVLNNLKLSLESARIVE